MASLVTVGPAHDAAGDLRVAEQASIAWISARPEYWPPIDGSGTLDIPDSPESGLGVACLVFGVGAGGADWINCLKRSDWFAGLEPRPEDLAVACGIPAGYWTVPVCRAGHRGRIDDELEAFVAQTGFPNAPLATVAVPREAGPSDLAAALALVSALRQRRVARGCRVAVIVTVEAGLPSAASGFVREMLGRGAFVVQAGVGVSGDHIHHFPLRAAIMPRRGRRLVCVDLADHLACWMPGSPADLHALTSRFDEAARVLSYLPALGDATSSQVRALNLHAHYDLDAPGNLLTELDQLATHCRGLFLGPKGDMVFTTADRLDGVTGSADLLVIHEPRRPPITSASDADAVH